MEGDAELAPYSDVYATLTVPEVGPLRARRLMPNAVPTIAAAMNGPDHADHVVRLVSDHLADGELERVYVAMMTGDAPTDSMDKIVRALTTWGTARPYVAVVTLAVMTAHHWRTLRLRLVKSGVHDPMRLPSMHIVLDATEAAVLEAMAHDSMERTVFLDRLYSPLHDPGAPRDVAPTGFTDDDVESSFDAFAAAAR